MLLRAANRGLLPKDNAQVCGARLLKSSGTRMVMSRNRSTTDFAGRGSKIKGVAGEELVALGSPPIHCPLGHNRLLLQIAYLQRQARF